MSPNDAQVKIYVVLLNEGTHCARPTEALSRGGLYEVLATPNYGPEDEEWEFKPGSIVRLEKLRYQDGELLTAVSAEHENK